MGDVDFSLSRLVEDLTHAVDIKGSADASAISRLVDIGLRSVDSKGGSDGDEETISRLEVISLHSRIWTEREF